LKKRRERKEEKGQCKEESLDDMEGECNVAMSVMKKQVAIK
jgi:hypothetical protein